MKKIFYLVLLVVLLEAQNPRVYAALGDMLYDNVSNVAKLKDISKFKNFTSKIDLYISKVYKAKDMGYMIESGDKSIDKKAYLKTLRALNKEYESLSRMTLKYFKKSMLEKNNEVFTKTLNSRLFDSTPYKDEILDYYFKYMIDTQPEGVLKSYVDEYEEKELARQRMEELKRKSRLTKKQIQEAKIRRLRQRAKERDEALQRELERKLMEAKERIRQEQLRELRN